MKNWFIVLFKISPTSSLLKQQAEVHFLAQERKPKDKLSTRIIDDTTLRFYFPMTLEVNSEMILEAFAATTWYVSASPLSHSLASTLNSLDKGIKNNQGPPLLLKIPSPSVHTMLTRFNYVSFYSCYIVQTMIQLPNLFNLWRVMKIIQRIQILEEWEVQYASVLVLWLIS